MTQAYFEKKKLTEEARQPMVTLHSRSRGYGKFIQNSKATPKPGPILQTIFVLIFFMLLYDASIFWKKKLTEEASQPIVAL